MKTKPTTPYYIDYVIRKDNFGTITETYFQLVRTKDDAIFFSSPVLDFVLAECFKRGIKKDEIVIL